MFMCTLHCRYVTDCTIGRRIVDLCCCKKASVDQIHTIVGYVTVLCLMSVYVAMFPM